MALPRRPTPRMACVRQRLASDHVPDPRAAVRQQLLDCGIGDRAPPGSRIAITAGSRGIGGFVPLLQGIVDALRVGRAEPFIVPAMGSHGGATPEGQVEILRRLGATEQVVGAPIRATMETVNLGRAANGATAHLDQFAAAADGIIVLGRVKTHPESAGELASGLLKMCTVGLGKQAGAHEAHSHGLWDSVRAVPKLQLAHGKILCGVAVVENGFRHPCAIEVVAPTYDAFLEADMRLLRLAKQHLARIPFDALDVLVVDELGKTVSGAGMDPNVIGTWRVTGAPPPHHPDYSRIVVLSLTQGSLGNGLGIGLADFTTQRFLSAYDATVSYINLLTATEPGGNTREGPLPLALESDRDAIEVALFSALADGRPRVCRIKNTAELGEFWVSEGLIPAVRGNAALELAGEPEPVRYDSAGNLF
jgi:Lactate racemase N-terminal domain